MADTPNGETATPKVLENEQANPSTPAVNQPTVKTEDSAVEQLRKEKEQAEMRANQLANQLKAEQEAKEAQKAKELEEQNQFKELYEQEKAKREAVESEIEAKERQEQLASTKSEILKDFSEETRALVSDLGIDLSDLGEEAVATFKEKVQKADKRVAKTGDVSANNQPLPKDGKIELTTEELRSTLQSDESFHDLIMKKYPGIASMTNQR